MRELALLTNVSQKYLRVCACKVALGHYQGFSNRVGGRCVGIRNQTSQSKVDIKHRKKRHQTSGSKFGTNINIISGNQNTKQVKRDIKHRKTKFKLAINQTSTSTIKLKKTVSEQSKTKQQLKHRNQHRNQTVANASF